MQKLHQFAEPLFSTCASVEPLALRGHRGFAMDFRITSQPLASEQMLEVVSVADVKKNARITHGLEDDQISASIEAAYDFLDGQGWLNGYWMLETAFEMFVPSFGATLEIPIRPVLEEGSVAVARLQSDGTYEALPADAWTVVQQDGCAVVAVLSKTDFPIERAPHPRAYKISFKAGHASADKVPAGLKKSIVLLASHFYANREATMSDSRVTPVSREIEFGVRKLAAKYRMHLDHS